MLSRLRTIGLLLISLVFVGLGILLLTAGERPGLALACIALFGACAIVFALDLLPKRPLVPEPDGAIVVRGSRARFVVLGLSGAAMAAACPMIATMAAAENDWRVAVIAWAGAIFFGFGALYLLWRATRSPDLWRLDAEGVQSLAGVKWRLPWRAIVSLRPFEIRGQRFLALDVHPDFAPPPSLARGLSRALGVPQFAIGAQGAAAAYVDIEAHVVRLWRAAQG
ncbi:MAG: STM3941 family protein [Hyphomonadaceae bacterium]